MLVGRTLELDVLKASFRQMLEGKGNILFLTGEAGLGKTTLVHEWWKTIAPDTASYAEAACSIPIGNVDVGRLEALQPWADIVAQLEHYEAKGKRKLDLKKLIFDSAPAWAWALPIVGGIAHGAMETARLVKQQQSDHNPNASNQQQVFQQYVNLLTKIAEQTPLVILLDDMHWADTSSTNLLFYLSRQINEKKILVLVTYRPDDASAANKGEGHPIIQVKNEILRYGGKGCSLSYLDRNAISELLIKTFQDYKTDDTFERWLLKISDGNSLFVAQFIKTLHEDNWLTDYGKFVGQYEHITVPASALAVVEERTRRLDRETCELLRYATAEGEEFTSFVLGRLKKTEPMELLKELRRAESEGIVRKIGSTRLYANQTTTVFGFSHALFHQALYQGLLDEEKEVLHRRCFEILKTEWDRLSGTKERTNSLASKLLTHAEKCGEIETAAAVALEAARGAWHTYAEAEALEMLSHVFHLADANASLPATLRIDALILKADIHYLLGRYEESLNAATNALKYSQILRDDARSAKAMQQNGKVYFHRGAYDEALDYYANSLAIQESIGDRKGIASSLNNIGNVYNWRGAYGEALEYYAKALAINESTGDRAGIATSLASIGNVHNFRGAYNESLEYYAKALAIRESIGDRAGIANSLINIGVLHGSRGAYDDALEYFTKSLAMQESIGERDGIARSLLNIGVVHGSRGAYDDALEYYAKSLVIQESIGDRASIAAALVNIGVVQLKQGNLPEARTALTKSKNTAVEIRSTQQIAYSLCELGLLCEAEAMQRIGAARTEKISEAVALLEEGLAIFREIKSAHVKKYEPELERIKQSMKSEG